MCMAKGCGCSCKNCCSDCEKKGKCSPKDMQNKHEHKEGVKDPNKNNQRFERK